jgi:hypothetical protein
MRKARSKSGTITPAKPVNEEERVEHFIKVLGDMDKDVRKQVFWRMGDGESFDSAVATVNAER